MAWNSHIRDTMRLDTSAMREVQFADGDTLGGTVPLTLMQAVKPAQRAPPRAVVGDVSPGLVSVCCPQRWTSPSKAIESRIAPRLRVVPSGLRS